MPSEVDDGDASQRCVACFESSATAASRCSCRCNVLCETCVEKWVAQCGVVCRRCGCAIARDRLSEMLRELAQMCAICFDRHEMTQHRDEDAGAPRRLSLACIVMSVVMQLRETPADAYEAARRVSDSPWRLVELLEELCDLIGGDGEVFSRADRETFCDQFESHLAACRAA